MNHLAVKVWLSFMLLLLGTYGAYTVYRVSRSQSIAAANAEIVKKRDARPLADFNFIERSGKRVNLGELKGQVWVASFFFANCPGFCLQMNRTVAQLQKELVDQGVKIISITVDPENDTPDRLKQYSENFNADPESWLFLTGRFTDARDLGQDVFQVSVQGKDHSDRLILVDREGKVRGRYSSLYPPDLEKFRKEVQQVLAEQPAQEAKAAGEKAP